MNISEQANKYAEGKANEAITKAIADAYMEGYKAGYKDREEEIPMELRDNKTEYVDLGLPSGTLWATDYEKLDGEQLYLPYCEAERMKLPTQEQWEELRKLCRWEFKIDNAYDYCSATCVGPNGKILLFERTGFIKTKEVEDSWAAYFWMEDEDNNSSEKTAMHLYNSGKINRLRVGAGGLSSFFSGYKLPVRLVR